MSRSIEQELTKLSIPSRMLGGHKFFDRIEIKDILSYLSLADNPSYVLGFSRIINVPKRGIGEKLLEEFFDIAESMNKKPMELADEIVYGTKAIKGIKPTLKRALDSVLRVLRTVRKLAQQGRPVTELIDKVIDLIDYKVHLAKDPNIESRMQNLEELKSFATTVASSGARMQDLPNLNYEPPSSSTTTTTTTSQIVEAKDEAQPSSLIKTEVTSSQTIKAEEESASQDIKLEEAASQEIKVKEEVSEPIKVEEKEEPSAGTRRSSRKRTRVNPASSYLEAGTEAEFEGEAEEVDEDEEFDEDENESQDEEAPPKKVARKETKPMIKREEMEVKQEDGSISPGPPLFADSVTEKTPLREFLECCTLSTDMESEEASAEDKVTISTVHSAKGLECEFAFFDRGEKRELLKASINSSYFL